mmetsp:Transcript_51959/g.166361  ORF Transcript_51959/g.166361 Transcript_51959/m.166361 type:complete len:211 (-) Transcript_51959:3-635(-)
MCAMLDVVADGSLGRPVHGRALVALLRRHGGVVDDGARALLPHDPRRVLRAHHDAAEEVPHRVLHVLLVKVPVGEVVHAAARRHVGPACIVEEDVEAPEGVLRGHDGPLDVCLLHDVRLDEDRGARGLALEDDAADRLVAAGEDHLAALLHEEVHGGLADAGGAAGDHGDLAVQPAHGAGQVQLPGRRCAGQASGAGTAGARAAPPLLEP